MKIQTHQVYTAMNTCKKFMPIGEYRSMVRALNGEESQYLADKFLEIAERISTMPKTYEQDGLGDQAMVYLHYFRGAADFWITEKDAETPYEPGQHQAFGLANLGHGESELGYISIVELIANNVELDLYFEPKTLAEVKASRVAYSWAESFLRAAQAVLP